MYIPDLPMGYPEFVGLMRTVVGAYVISTGAWYPWGKQYRPGYETVVYDVNEKTRMKLIQYRYNDVRKVFWAHMNIVRQFRRRT